jgi:predicted dehydrogenase
MKGKRRLGVAVAGLGAGESHARTNAGLESCELRWLHDLSGERAVALARDIGRGRIARGLDEILADPAVDAVSVASYDDAHAGHVLAAPAAGKHVFVEKPLCRSGRHEMNAVRPLRYDRCLRFLRPRGTT